MQEEVDRRVQEYYGTEFDEAARLQRPSGWLELVRVQELVSPLLEPGSRVLDVGGGPGVHARWLAGAGHRVHLVDPVPRHVEQAAALPGVTAAVGDARRLEQEDDSQDAVLLCGPLYHLESREDRVRALAEAARVTRPGGRVFAAVIPRWAVYTDALTDLPDGAPAAPELHRIMDTGQSHPQARFPGAHFHTSRELAAEMELAGLQVESLEALEGPAGIPMEFVAQVDDEVLQAALVLVRALGRVPGPREMSGHLLGTGRVPEA